MIALSRRVCVHFVEKFPCPVSLQCLCSCFLVFNQVLFGLPLFSFSLSGCFDTVTSPYHDLFWSPKLIILLLL